MSRAAFLVREAMVNIRRNLLLVTGAVLAVFLSLVAAFAALIAGELLRINTLAWQDGVHVIAFLYDEGTDGVVTGAHESLLAEISSWPEVKNSFYVDKSQAWLEYQEIFANRPDMLTVDPSVLPTSIRIELVEPDSYQDVEFLLAQQSQLIREVRAPGEQIDFIASLRRTVSVWGLGIAIFFGVSAVVLISNTIRLAIYARRDEVAIMKLVGASNWFVRIPFLLEGLISGLAGAAIAVVAVWLGTRALSSLDQGIELITFTVPASFVARWGTLLLFFGAAAGVLGSVLGLSRYLRDDEGGRPVTGARRVLEPM